MWPADWLLPSSPEPVKVFCLVIDVTSTPPPSNDWVKAGDVGTGAGALGNVIGCCAVDAGAVFGPPAD